MRNHRIRQAGPWEAQLIETDGQPDGEVIRCQLPFTLSESRGAAGVLLNRGFHCPTGIDGTTTLRIVLQVSEMPHTVLINGTNIVECAASLDAEFAFDVTGRLTEFNLLSVLCRSSNHESPATLNIVWLEILGEPTAIIPDVSGSFQ